MWSTLLLTLEKILLVKYAATPTLNVSAQAESTEIKFNTVNRPPINHADKVKITF